eukprot:6396566-Alexandrium_andersonii.AAC.1
MLSVAGCPEGRAPPPKLAGPLGKRCRQPCVPGCARACRVFFRQMPGTPPSTNSAGMTEGSCAPLKGRALP